MNSGAFLRKHFGVVRSVGALLSANVSTSILGAVGGLLVARFAGPEIIGRFRVFTIPLMYLTFLHLGTFDGLWRQIPFYMARGETEEVERVASAGGAWAFILSGSGSVGFVSCAFWSLLRHDFFGVAGWLSQALVCWGTYYSGYLRATFRSLDQFVALARIQAIQGVLNFLLVFPVAILGFYGLCLRSALPVVAGVFQFHKKRPLDIKLRLNPKVFIGLVRIGFPLSFWGSLYSSLWVAAEYTLMLKLAGVEGVGFFSVAVVLREGLAVFPRAVQQVFLPRAVDRFAREGDLRGSTAESVKVGLLVTVAMAAVVVVASMCLTLLLPLVLPKFVGGISMMKFCMWMAVVTAAGLPLNVLFSTGKGWLYGKGILVGIIFFPIAVYILSPFLGNMLAVVAGSLAGRVARTLVAYFDLAVLTIRARA